MTESDKARRLRGMKLLATGLLVAMAMVFASTWIWFADVPWIGYVRATSEAAMVGALADWFAVTALFRYPLGIPIPHTAIVPRRKDEIGESLASFVRDNFLQEAALQPRLQQMDFGAATGRWLSNPDNAARVARDLSGLFDWLLQTLDDDTVQTFLRENLHLSLRELRVAPLAGRILDLLATSDRHQELFDRAMHIASEQLAANKYKIRARIDERSPWWIPGFVDREVYDKIVLELEGMIERIGTDRNHPARESFNEAVRDLIARLKNDEAMNEQAERFKQELLDEPSVQGYLTNLWGRLRDHLSQQAGDPGSGLNLRLQEGLVRIGESLIINPDMRDVANRWVRQAIVHSVANYRGEMAAVISDTVRSWDPQMTSRRVELQVGRDLQFIRINGTLVGGLAGLAIYMIVQAFAVH